MTALDLRYHLADLDLDSFQAGSLIPAPAFDSQSTRPGIRFVDHSASGTRSCGSCGGACTCAETMCHNCAGTACHYHED